MVILSIYNVYTKHIHCLFFVYTMYILGIYIVYFWCIQCVSLVYTVYMHSIICVYTPSGGWCCGGGHGLIPQAPPAITSESPGRVITFILLEQVIKCHARNIPCIFKVYTECLPVDKLLSPVAGLAPRLFIVLQPYNRAFASHLPASVPYFPGIYML